MLAIKATDETLEAYNTMKLGKKVAFLIFKITGADITVDVNKLKADDDVPDDYRQTFIDEIKSTGQPRFAVVDYNGKLLFVSWVPETSKAQNKMKYATCKEGFVQELVGIQIKLQATDDGELTPEIIEEKTKSNV